MKPQPFNPDFRPGYREAIDQAYTQYCEDHPEASGKELAIAHCRIAEDLKSKYPSIGESQ